MKYIIGIDLGTTNCTVSYSEIDVKTPDIKLLSIDQSVGLEQRACNNSLPSFLYFPTESEAKLLGPGPSVGMYARERSGETPERTVSSAKSWLSHGGVDRRSSILPLGDGEHKLSPIEAVATYLKQIKLSWNNSFEDPLEEQEVLVTVPASFDPDARQMVQEALLAAGYPENIALLEEPQAALYAWIYRQGESWRNKISVGDSILVADIGGGTSDFSLVKVGEEGGNLTIERTAVGEHLLLGGDNIDWSLAYYVSNKLQREGHIIDDWQINGLVGICRQAKERLLSGDTSEEQIVLKGRGRSLIGGSIKTSLTVSEIENVVLEGFLPRLDYSSQPHNNISSALSALGLPYAKDPRITCHLAAFISRNIGECDKLPEKILFNGGVLKSPILQDRLVEQLHLWSAEQGCHEVAVLEDGDLDYAVSCGAVYYGFARRGEGVRIKSSVSRSYFIGVEESRPAIPGMPVPMRAICIVPYGMEEGSEAVLEGCEFALILGQKAHFHFMSCNSMFLPDNSTAIMGSVVRSWKKDLHELHPIESFMEGNKNENIVKVKLLSKVTELGTLELWCVAEDERRWKLEFDLR